MEYKVPRFTVLTSGRADYSILTPILKRLAANPRFELRVAAFGMHLLPQNKSGLSAIKADGYALDVIEAIPYGDTPKEIAISMGETSIAFSRYFESSAPEVLLCVGDRYEILAAVSASVPFNLPVIHLHGGEETAGAMDDQFRDAITAMASLHFTAHEKYANRVREIIGSKQKNTIFNVGAPSIDAIVATPRLDAKSFEHYYGVNMQRPTLLATYHPETRRGAETLKDAAIFAVALCQRTEQVLLTLPNVDTYGQRLTEILKTELKDRPNTYVVEMLGRQGYYSALDMCAMVVGNSSSGIIEAASFKKPVVNIGERQAGRLRGPNVIDCSADVAAINSAIEAAYKIDTSTITNIFGDGGSSERIVSILEQRIDEGCFNAQPQRPK